MIGDDGVQFFVVEAVSLQTYIANGNLEGGMWVIPQGPRVIGQSSGRRVPGKQIFCSPQ